MQISQDGSGIGTQISCFAALADGILLQDPVRVAALLDPRAVSCVVDLAKKILEVV